MFSMIWSCTLLDYSQVSIKYKFRMLRGNMDKDMHLFEAQQQGAYTAKGLTIILMCHIKREYFCFLLIINKCALWSLNLEINNSVSLTFATSYKTTLRTCKAVFQNVYDI